MAKEKYTITLYYDTEDPDWINFDFDGLNGVSGNDPIEDFIKYTLPTAIEEALKNQRIYRG